MSDDFIEWKEKTTVFQDLGASTQRPLNLLTPEGSINVAASVVTPGFYQTRAIAFPSATTSFPTMPCLVRIRS